MNKKLFLSFKIIFCIFLTFQFGSNISAATHHGITSIVYNQDLVTLNDYEFIKGFVCLDAGLSICTDARVFIDTWVPVDSFISFGPSGTLTLSGDLYLASNFTFSECLNALPSKGFMSGGGSNGTAHTIFLGGKLTLPDKMELEFLEDIVIDGQGNELFIDALAQLILDANVTLTLKNLTLTGSTHSAGRPPIRLNKTNSRLALDNVKIAFSNDWTFSFGQLYIHNEVSYTGTSEFIYTSTSDCYIAPDSTFYFEPGTSFYYGPIDSRNPVTAFNIPDNTNMYRIIMEDETSVLYLDNCTLKVTDTGLRLTKGQLYLDNKITLSLYEKHYQDSYDTGLVFGDGSASGNDLNVYILSGANVEVDGFIKYDNVS